MNPIRLVVVDDHDMVRSGLECLISDDPDMETVGSLKDRAEVVPFLRETAADVVLIDLTLQDGNGLELIRDIAARELPVRMLVVSMHDENLFAERSLRAGAHGYICKTAGWEEIRIAIMTVAAGETAVSDEVASRLVGRITNGSAPRQSGLETLSDREFVIYEAIGQGATVREIAATLHLSPKTVESYRDRIRGKLDIDSAMELTRHATIWTLNRSVLGNV